MSDLTKREFTELALDGYNYLTWALDVEIHLASYDLSGTIVANTQSSPAQKAKALIFLRHHINQDLKNEYLTEKDPFILWKSLNDRFHQQTDIILPQAQYDWLNLRFQDFKTVTDYNSALHRIVSKLKLCQQKISETELIQKTLSTFHASNLVLQQQYRAKNYTTHSELISALLVAEKHNQLLMRNHNARPVGSQPVPEAHAMTRRNNNEHGRGRGRGRDRGRGRGFVNNRGGRGRDYGNNHDSRGRDYDNNRDGRGRGRGTFNKAHFQNRGNHINYTRAHPPKSNSNQQQFCYRCGCDDHWSRTCRTPMHLIEAYQRLQKNKKGKAPQGESNHTSLPEANMNIDEDDFLRVELEDCGDNQ